MDSFFSLFDPSDGNQNKPAKKRHKSEQDKKIIDTPKGRRRGRRSQGKNETLPEESSFLCEPDLSTEILVKDCSYIENYIEVNNKDDEVTNTKETDRKPRRRNSGRKNRRKKNRISPGKEFVPGVAWGQDGVAIPNETNLNNFTAKPKNCPEIVGKNVNNLTDYKKDRRKHATDNETDHRVYDVIDKLEKVGIKDNMYLSGDFDDEDLGSDFFYSDEETDEFQDDSTSDASESGDEWEGVGALPPEPRFGNVEYKLQLVSPCERRFQHLVTQLKWRLRSGGGSAVYVIGVRDCGALRGLRAQPLRASLRALRKMAGAIGAELVSVRARRVAPSRAVAEVYIRKMADTEQSVELRIAVMGANEAGKSTLIGVLTQGELDNGRGSARLNMFRHLHEVKSGRTSSLSHEILGFDAQGNVVNYGCSELMTAERIGERSAKLVSFLDLAGHSKYQRTTVHGLTGYSPHHAMLVISATAGITSITEEHLELILALDLPFFVVISKCELASAAVPALVETLAKLLASADKKPLLITDENLARDCVLPQKSILDTIGQTDEETLDEPGGRAPVGVFPVSSVRGAGLRALHAYLLALAPAAPPPHCAAQDLCEFQIDEIFHVGDSSGPVVGGLVVRGVLCEGDEMLLGPLESGQFVPTVVRSVYRNRVPCGRARAGHAASLLLPRAPALRPGMVLLAKKSQKQPTQEKNHKNVRRKNTNLLQDIENVQNIITKSFDESGDVADVNVNKSDVNVKTSDSSVKSDVNVKMVGVNEGIDKMAVGGDAGAALKYFGDLEDGVWLEDPDNPRGCIYFQAQVQVRRHATAISRGFQCSVHVGNVRQTAVVEGILSANGTIRAGESAAVVFRFVRCPEHLVRGRRLLITAGTGTRAIGRITQTFPYIP